jgi:hypothetical protein
LVKNARMIKVCTHDVLHCFHTGLCARIFRNTLLGSSP